MAITLKALRVNAGLTQKQLAEVMHITPETIGNWERGKTYPDVKQITELEKIFNVGYSDINFLVSDVGLTEMKGEQ